MQTDLHAILDGWEYEPGKISVRKVIGVDGREKIQTRVDLGLLQFELEDRPDGTRPYGSPSLLHYFERRLQQHLDRHGTDEAFAITSDACRELRHEAHQYYQRYLSFFVLEDFTRVARDTEHNLRTIDFCAEYGETEYDQTALETQRAYVMMMNARARAYHALNQERFEQALRIVARAITDLENLEGYEDEGDLLPEPRDVFAEIRVLEGLREEINEKLPASSLVRLEQALAEAIDAEDYELAAELRDQIEARDRSF